MLVSRDPYARTELHRETVCTNESCSWCDQRRPSLRLFQYRIRTDGDHTSIIPGLFCSVGCKRAYYDEEE